MNNTNKQKFASIVKELAMMRSDQIIVQMALQRMYGLLDQKIPYDEFLQDVIDKEYTDLIKKQ